MPVRTGGMLVVQLTRLDRHRQIVLIRRQGAGRVRRECARRISGLIEIRACLPWLNAEIALIKPQVLVCLGATAAQALLGKQFRVTQHRGEFVESPLAPRVMATVHPSSILRAPDDETRHAETQRFVEDLKKVAAVLK